MKGNPTIFNDKLAILTLDDCLYMLDMRMIVQSGSIISPVHNDSNQMTRSDYVFPVLIHDKLIVPFSNWRVSSF
ncbi:hypothetical protein [Wolbachia endosymbiont of Wuchereria bancrofti]|uniref:hypothetical protein n=1 Tax=Wolbachia endosymbiont of Wuchereria bancrofti TaxID=96496 RepID=UPI000B4C426F|nr:hypothetical protein [Wolbachia endosymbiont of Wuchereria bancrofti]